MNGEESSLRVAEAFINKAVEWNIRLLNPQHFCALSDGLWNKPGTLHDCFAGRRDLPLS
jgi:hypothetical protein